jgi:hypothetical protein
MLNFVLTSLLCFPVFNNSMFSPFPFLRFSEMYVELKLHQLHLRQLHMRKSSLTLKCTFSMLMAPSSTDLMSIIDWQLPMILSTAFAIKILITTV